MELKEALFIVLAFLFPLWVYCLFLAAVNRRPRPVVVAGTWDFLGVVLALSGFLVVGGPAALSNLTTAVHALPQATDEPAALAPRQVLLGTLLVLYFVVLVVGVAAVLRQRRGVTAVYNVNPAVFDEVFGQVLDQLGYGWTRAGNRYYLRSAEPVSSGERTVIVEADAFPPLCHVTVRWDGDDRATRQEVEGELTRALAAVRTRYNPAGGWFLSAAAALFLLMGAVLLLLLLAKAVLRV
jgi:hypothetical protein